MPQKQSSALKVPKPLKPLAKMLKARGFRLAVPFDDIREPGYIGTFLEGQEIIVDDGTCLKPFVTLKKRTVALGDTTKSSKFNLKGFLGIFGGLLGINFDFHRAKNVSIRFPKRFVPSQFITTLDITEDLSKVSPACRKALEDRDNFLIVQTLQTDSLEYKVDTKKNLTVDAKAQIDKAVKGVSDFNATVKFESARQYSIVIQGKTVTVAYKRISIPTLLD